MLPRHDHHPLRSPFLGQLHIRPGHPVNLAQAFEQSKERTVDIVAVVLLAAAALAFLVETIQSRSPLALGLFLWILVPLARTLDAVI